MSSELPVFPPKCVEPKKSPSWLVGTLIFLTLTLAGIAAAIFTWPSQQSTHTVWFWVWIVMYPVLASTLILSRCFSAYEGRRLDAQAWNSARERYIERAFDLASVPMSILHATFVAMDDDKNALTLLEKEKLALRAQPSIAETGTVTARWLKPDEIEHRKWARGPDTRRQTDVLKWVLRRLIDETSLALLQLPSEIPLTVNLQVCANALQSDAAMLWSEIWTERNFRPTPVHTECMPLSSIESWLDGNDSALKRSVMLLVSVNLNKILSENPPQNSAEAGVALLLAHPDVTSACIKEPIAMLHRSSQGNNPESLARAVRYALRWGKTEARSIGSLWLTGIEDATVVTVHQALSRAGAVSDRSGSLLEIDVERTVGHTGVTAPWLSVALATGMIQKTAVPQLILQQLKDTFSMTVVTPPPSKDVRQSLLKNDAKIQD